MKPCPKKDLIIAMAKAGKSSREIAIATGKTVNNVRANLYAWRISLVRQRELLLGRRIDGPGMRGDPTDTRRRTAEEVRLQFTAWCEEAIRGNHGEVLVPWGWLQDATIHLAKAEGANA